MRPIVNSIQDKLDQNGTASEWEKLNESDLDITESNDKEVWHEALETTTYITNISDGRKMTITG